MNLKAKSKWPLAILLFNLLAFTSVKAQCNLPSFNDWQNIIRITYNGNWMMNNSGNGWATPPPPSPPFRQVEIGTAATVSNEDFGLNDYTGDTNFNFPKALLNSPVIRVGKKFNQQNQGELSPVRRASVITFTFRPTQTNCKVRVYYLGMLQQYSTRTDYYDAAVSGFRCDAPNSARQAASFGLFCRYNYTSGIPNPNTASYCGQTEFGVSNYNSGTNSFAIDNKNLRYGLNDMFSFYQAGTNMRQFPANTSGNTSLNKRMTGWDFYDMDFSEFIDANVTITLFANTSNMPGDTQNHSYCYYQFQCLSDPQTALPNSLLDIADKNFGCVASAPTNININITDNPPTLLANRTNPTSGRINNNNNHQWLNLLGSNALSSYANNFASLKLELANSSGGYNIFTNYNAPSTSDTSGANNPDIRIAALPSATPTSQNGNEFIYRFKATYATRNNPNPQIDIFEIRYKLDAPTLCAIPSTGVISATNTAGPVNGAETSICKPKYPANPSLPHINITLGAADCANVTYRWQKKSATATVWTDITGATGINLVEAQDQVDDSSCFTQFRRGAVTTSTLCNGSISETVSYSTQIFTIRNNGYVKYGGTTNIEFLDWQTGGQTGTSTGLEMTSAVSQVIMCYGNRANINFNLAMGGSGCGYPASLQTNATVKFYLTTSSNSLLPIGTPVNYSFTGDALTSQTISLSYQAINDANGVLNIVGGSDAKLVPITMVIEGTRDGCPFKIIKDYITLIIIPRGIGGAIKLPASGCPLTVENNNSVPTMSYDASGLGQGYDWQYTTSPPTTSSSWVTIPNQGDISLPLWTTYIMNIPRPFWVKRIAHSTNNCGGAQDSNILLIPADPVPLTPSFTLPASFCKTTASSQPVAMPVASPAVNGSWYQVITPVPSISATVTGLDIATMATGAYSYIFVPTNINASCYDFVLWNFTIYNAPNPTISGATQLASGETTTITASISGGTWASSNTLVATVNSSGVVTAEAPGTTTLSYTVTGTVGCQATATLTITVPAIQNCTETTTWDGATWDNGAPTTPAYLNKNVLFIADYTANQDIYACSLKVDGNAVVTIKHIGTSSTNTANTVTVKNQVTVNSAAKLEFEDDTSLVQINNTFNSGNIKYTRETPLIGKLDYVYWSSPVAGQALVGLTPIENPSPMYLWNPFINNWAYTPNSTLMTTGKGYIIRGPYTNVNTILPYAGNFRGVPNNGLITIPVENAASKMNLIGNPYPSALDIDCFLSDPANTQLNGAVYLWSHNIPIDLTGGTQQGTPGSALLNYNISSYAAYNRLGGVGTGIVHLESNGISTDRPLGKIAAGQSFFIEANNSGVATFKNSMRIGSVHQENSQFYRSTAIPAEQSRCINEERHRLWLHIKNNTSNYYFKQTLVGYSPLATTSSTLDRDYDAKTFMIEPYTINLYSLSPGNEKLTIQGRQLNASFDTSDVIPLGFTCKIAGTAPNTIEIGISEYDGLFDNVPIYLRETLTDGSYAYYDIKTSPHQFSISTIVLDDTRFAIVFSAPPPKTANQMTKQYALAGIPNPFNKNFSLDLKTSFQGEVQVNIYDVLGKLIEYGTYTTDDLKNHNFGTQLSSGFYQVVVSQGSQKETVKMIKK